MPVIIRICFQNTGFSYNSISIEVSSKSTTATYSTKLINMERDINQCHLITVTLTLRNSQSTRQVKLIDISLENLLSAMRNTLVMMMQLPC